MVAEVEKMNCIVSDLEKINVAFLPFPTLDTSLNIEENSC